MTIRDSRRQRLAHEARPHRGGECRSGEALDMLQAMNTGHEGSLTTLHATPRRRWSIAWSRWCATSSIFRSTPSRRR